MNPNYNEKVWLEKREWGEKSIGNQISTLIVWFLPHTQSQTFRVDLKSDGKPVTSRLTSLKII